MKKKIKNKEKFQLSQQDQAAQHFFFTVTKEKKLYQNNMKTKTKKINRRYCSVSYPL